MNEERVYIVEFCSANDDIPCREIITATSIPQLFDYYIDMTKLTMFAFQDVTDLSVEDIERKLTYNGKYSL